MWTVFYQLASPKEFYRLTRRLQIWLWVPCLVLLSYGLFAGLLLAPADYQQGDAFRIIYIHVPSAALSLGVFAFMAICSGIYLIWRIKLADILAKVSAPIGAWFTFLALITGAIWGKPMWGAWWIWDARLTSELILLFLYFGIMGLRTAMSNSEVAGRAAAIFALVGVVDLPIIHFSVNWWNTLHQKATVLKFARPSIDPSMLYPLLSMLLGFFLYYVALMVMRARQEILVRERRAQWVKDLQRE